MKIGGRRIEAFLARPDAAVAAVLIYGPDRGLVDERCRSVVHALAGAPPDPFRFVELAARSLRADPARLADEAAALGFGGRRVVWVRDAGDSVAPLVAQVLEQASASADLIVLEGGELGPRSALRKLAEGARNAAAIPCYVDAGDDLADLVVRTLAAAGLRAGADATAYLADSLGGDRAVVLGELDKLALYKGGAGEVTLDDAQACIGDSAAVSLDAVVYAAGGGDLAPLERALALVFADGASPVTVLRAMARHLMRLHLARALVGGGKPALEAIKALRPPVFFKHVDPFRSQMAAWRGVPLAAALAAVTEAELACKTTGQPAALVCSRALNDIAGAARHR